MSTHLRRAIFSTVMLLGQVTGAPSTLGSEEAPKSYPVQFKPSPAIVVTTSPPEGSAFAWQTEHFLLLSDQKIQSELIKRFATTIESIPAILKAYPLPVWSPLGNQRPIIRLCSDEQRFSEFGGPEGSAGIYNGTTNDILIRADLFLNPPGSSTRLKEPPDEDILVHELCHLSMAGTMRPSRPWLNEGLAEYFSVAHLRGGHYRFDQTTASIPKHVHRRLGLKAFDSVELPALSEVLRLSLDDWNERLSKAAPEEGFLPYATALLFVHYNIEGGISRRTDFEEFIKELNAFHFRSKELPKYRVEDPEQIEARLVKFWSSRGLKLQFAPDQGSPRPD